MKKSAYFALVILISLTGLSFSQSAMKNIQVSLEDKQIQDLSPEGLSLVFYVKIKNTSSKSYYLSKYNYRFVINESEYIRLETPLGKSLGVTASGETMIALPVKITYELLFKAIGDIRELDKVQCYLMGELTFSDERRERGILPIAFSGEFPIFRVPEIEFDILKLNTLTIGGADLTFEAKIKNANGFEIHVERIRYSIKLGGHLIENGNLGETRTIEPHGDVALSRNMLINFFDVGKDIEALLQKSSIQCQLTGELEFSTLWGKMKLPLDKTEIMPLSKIPNP
jgi:LEA14-like dessication related protein